MIDVYRRGFASRGLEFAIWGHLSDGNLHPNALPRNGDEVQRAQEAQLEFAAEAARRGGCPLSEHGVGRSRLKQEILRRFLGPAAIATMREIKAALDPDARLAPGVILPG
jgi:D-lactate dehydrogenase (cytochrome)